MATNTQGAAVDVVETKKTADDHDEKDYDYIFMYKTKDEKVVQTASCFGMKKKDTSGKVKRRKLVISRLREMGLKVDKVKNADESECYRRIGAPLELLEKHAEHMEFQMKLKDEHGGGYAEFKLNRKHLFEGSGDDRFFTSLQRQAIIKDIIENKKREGGAEINPAKELHAGTFLQFYPLHDPVTVGILRKSWASVGAMRRSYFVRQPLDDVRAYLGESVAIYFAWLGHYTTWLSYSSLVGLIIFIIQQGTKNNDDGGSVVFAVFLSLWATLFLESWKRKNAELAFKWNMLDFEQLEKTRPEFEGEDKTGIWVNGVFVELTPDEGGKSQPKSVYFNPITRVARTVFGLPFIFTILILAVASTLGVITIRIVLQKIDKNYAIAASIINAISIIVLNQVYSKIALALNEWENHRTDTDYDDALIAKTFAFQFVNSYIMLYYIAFFQHWVDLFDDPNLNDACKYPACITQVTVQLGTVLATNIFVGQTQEVGVPYIQSLIKASGDRKRAAKLAAEHDASITKEEQKKLAKQIKLSQAEIQGNYSAYGGTFGEFNEMVIQYGYVTMFAASFTLAPLLALLNNIIEIRSDAFKFITATQRPEYAGARDIGTWYKILNVIGYVAVLTNCLIISITSTAIKDQLFSSRVDPMYSPIMATILVTVILEHVIILAKFLVSEVIPDEPAWVKIALARQTYFKERALDQFDGAPVDEFTDDDKQFNDNDDED